MLFVWILNIMLNTDINTLIWQVIHLSFALLPFLRIPSEDSYSYSPGCCSGACCNTASRCKPHGQFLPRGGATNAEQSSVPLWSRPWFCILAHVCLCNSHPWTKPNRKQRVKKRVYAWSQHCYSSALFQKYKSWLLLHNSSFIKWFQYVLRLCYM